MNNIWEIYENLKEMVYVSDMDTYELVYANRYAREKLGIDPTGGLDGQLCHKAIRKTSTPCSICNNDKLKPGEFLEWKNHNALLGKSFLMKTTMVEQEGRRYRIEVGIDISEYDEQKRTIKEFASNEALVNTAIRLALEESTPEQSIVVLLNHLGQSLRSDRVYIFEETDHHTVKNTYEWCAEGVEPQKEFLQDVPFEVVSLWYETFDKNENIIVKSLDSIRETHPRVYETLLPQQVDSLVVSPLIIKGKVAGFYGVDNPPKNFLNHISVMFMVLGYFISSMLRRRDLMERLGKMSFYDQLTGGLNRHGMNFFIEHIDSEKSIALVYCDVMGLKRVNDTLGHLEGDALLVRAYQCLVNSFEKENVFRIGGDEFLAMKSGVSKEDMDTRVENMKNSMKDFNVKFAVGSVWEPKCNGQIEELLKLADARMYEDKAEYYSKHPNDRRAR